MAVSGRFGRGGNLLLAGAVALYLVHGFAIARLFFNKFSRSKFGEFLFYASQPWLFFAPILVVGVLEHWLDFRERITTAELSKPKDEQ